MRLEREASATAAAAQAAASANAAAAAAEERAASERAAVERAAEEERALTSALATLRSEKAAERDALQGELKALTAQRDEQHAQLTEQMKALQVRCSCLEQELVAAKRMAEARERATVNELQRVKMFETNAVRIATRSSGSTANMSETKSMMNAQPVELKGEPTLSPANLDIAGVLAEQATLKADNEKLRRLMKMALFEMAAPASSQKLRKTGKGAA